MSQNFFSILHVRSTETPSSFYNLRTKHNMETKRTSLTSLAKVKVGPEAHGCKPWVTNLSMVPHTLGILTASITYCIILLEYVSKSQVNVNVL